VGEIRKGQGSVFNRFGGGEKVFVFFFFLKPGKIFPDFFFLGDLVIRCFSKKIIFFFFIPFFRKRSKA